LSTEWDGSFLNWLTMRRTDILRKVLTGGKTTTGEGSGYDRLIGEEADGSSRGIYKRITNAENYAPSTYSGNRKFVFTTGSGTSSFNVRNDLDSGNLANFNVAVRVPSPVEGVLQEVATRVRYGLAFYNTTTGGHIQVAVAGTSLSATINQINLTRPSTNTPIAETLWTVGGYFAQTASFSSGPGSGGPGPRYNIGDYQINNNNDPLNYGTGGAPRYPSCAKNFVLLITDGEPCADGNLPAGLSNYASGRSTYNCSGGSCPAVSPFLASTFPSCSAGGYVAGAEDVALHLHTADLRSAITGTQNLTIYPVFAFGKGSTLLRYTAINGGFEDSNGNGMPDLQSEWDKNGDGEPDNFYEATDGAELEQAIKNAISNMLTRVASGTAASVLATGEGSGANLIQASFYPRRRFGNDVIAWAGGLQNLWYQIDPFFSKSSIREDTVQESPYRTLHLVDDYVSQFYFDNTAQATKAHRWQDTTGTGSPLTAKPDVLFENVKNIWEAAQMLWDRDITTLPRTIYTTIDGSNFLSGDFTTANSSTLASYMQAMDLNGDGSNADEAANIISYLHGEDVVLDVAPNDGINDFRPRTVTIGGTTKVWKLGDILNSTPKLETWVPLNHYYTVYQDATYDAFTKTANYTSRDTVFVGANDGMLHAFKLGNLELTWSGQGGLERARLTGNDLGKERWAFVPKNVLPYLKYIPDPDYCHVYTVDLTPFLFDASINNPTGCTGDYWDCDKDVTSWRTIVIGGMRYGGACRNQTTICTDVDGDGQKDCVNTPAADLGYSSYFALDVTDERNPQLLWEFSSPELGFTTSGPAIVRISAKNLTDDPLHTKNGRWFVVFGSGPTGPVDSSYQQFMGRSDQNLKYFVLDLKTGALLRTIDTGVQYAFSGSLINATHDVNYADNRGMYQDDIIYAPYTKRTSSSPYTWTNGGVGRILTKEDIDPDHWTWHAVIDGIGPVTAAVAKLDNVKTGIMWLYFGTGRYYYAQGTAVDDPSGQRRLFGIKEPCASPSGTGDYLVMDTTCTSTVNFGTLTDVTNIANVPAETTADSSSFKGWYINLEQNGTYTYSPDPARNFGSERIITDPVSSTTGLVFFTSYKPYVDECALGGKSFIWATKYNTGGAGGALLKGKLLMQVSTGSIEQKDLSTAMTDAGGRRTAAIEGEPPVGQGLSILVPAAPTKRVLHLKER
jgi:type IV pilus assembly protein PilY1